MTLRNLALTYVNANEFEKAFEAFDELFKSKPILDDYFAYGCAKLQVGDFEEGWKNYEYRFKKEFGRPEYPETSKPRWEGQKFDGTLLVQWEQGFGDTFQFARFLHEVKPLVNKVIFRVQDCVKDLIEQSLKEIYVIGDSTSVEKLDYDYHIPLMCLPGALKTTKETIPYRKKYLMADENLVDEFKQKFFNNDCLKIGISFHGMALGNPYRNIPLAVFYKLCELKNVKIYSFQKDAGSEQLKKIPPEIEIIDMGTEFKNFSDTAAAMENLDLFVTSDNALFNLAGAMGKKTFGLLHHHAEWRWFFDTEKTPWYDSVKIFRKETEEESWEQLMQKVFDELNN
jgi:tetratricopeptide (TPR) repeat protein